MNGNKPILSSDFTLDDIRKLRDYNSSRHKKMSAKEINDDLQASVDKFNEQINLIRQNKGINIQR